MGTFRDLITTIYRAIKKIDPIYGLANLPERTAMMPRNVIVLT